MISPGSRSSRFAGAAKNGSFSGIGSVAATAAIGSRYTPTTRQTETTTFRIVDMKLHQRSNGDKREFGSAANDELGRQVTELISETRGVDMVRVDAPVVDQDVDRSQEGEGSEPEVFAFELSPVDG